MKVEKRSIKASMASDDSEKKIRRQHQMLENEILENEMLENEMLENEMLETEYREHTVLVNSFPRNLPQLLHRPATHHRSFSFSSRSPTKREI